MSNINEISGRTNTASKPDQTTSFLNSLTGRGSSTVGTIGPIQCNPTLPAPKLPSYPHPEEPVNRQNPGSEPKLPSSPGQRPGGFCGPAPKRPPLPTL